MDREMRTCAEWTELNHGQAEIWIMERQVWDCRTVLQQHRSQEGKGHGGGRRRSKAWDDRVCMQYASAGSRQYKVRRSISPCVPAGGNAMVLGAAHVGRGLFSYCLDDRDGMKRQMQPAEFRASRCHPCWKFASEPTLILHSCQPGVRRSPSKNSSTSSALALSPVRGCGTRQPAYISPCRE